MVDFGRFCQNWQQEAVARAVHNILLLSQGECAFGGGGDFPWLRCLWKGSMRACEVSNG
jgi:hypothetical protein